MGFILLIIGIVFLFKNLGYISGPAWTIIWPAILIVIGVGILVKRKRNHGFFWEERFGWRKKDYNPPTASSRGKPRAPIKNKE